MMSSTSDVDDLAEGRTDDHTDCQVDDAALHREFFELFGETHGIPR